MFQKNIEFVLMKFRANCLIVKSKILFKKKKKVKLNPCTCSANSINLEYLSSLKNIPLLVKFDLKHNQTVAVIQLRICRGDFSCEASFISVKFQSLT